MMGLKEAKDIVDAILPCDGTISTRQRILLIKALREASVAGVTAGRAEVDADGVFNRGFDAGYKKAMKDAEEEFQQRAIDYVVGCMKTADEVLKRVA